MNYTKTNRFEFIQVEPVDDTCACNYNKSCTLHIQGCNKCGLNIFLDLEDHYHRESVNHNSTQAWRHKHCFGRQKQ